jgi:hypothetical protein
MACCWPAKNLAELHQPDFDMEAATNTLSLWSRLDPSVWRPPSTRSVVKQLSRRFSVSKAATEVLIAAARRGELAAGWIREAHAEVLHLAEAAMNQAMKRPAAGGGGGLARITARKPATPSSSKWPGLVARRHQERIEGVEGLLGNAGPRWRTATARPFRTLPACGAAIGQPAAWCCGAEAQVARSPS